MLLVRNFLDFYATALTSNFSIHSFRIANHVWHQSSHPVSEENTYSRRPSMSNRTYSTLEFAPSISTLQISVTIELPVGLVESRVTLHWRPQPFQLDL
jgi:hypothetical protein